MLKLIVVCLIIILVNIKIANSQFSAADNCVNKKYLEKRNKAVTYLNLNERNIIE